MASKNIKIGGIVYNKESFAKMTLKQFTKYMKDRKIGLDFKKVHDKIKAAYKADA